MSEWLHVHEGHAPLIVAMPHVGAEIPPSIEPRLIDPWRARKDADWWIDQLYAFAVDLGATIIRTTISRTVIDLNRDPSGASLYPGQATTALCPTDTFDGEPLYQPGQEPDAAEIAHRRAAWFDPYHAVLRIQIERLRNTHGRVVLYDAHSIRSHAPRLFDGALPNFNIGTNNGATCAQALSDAVAAACADTTFSSVVNGRFRGGWTTRHYGEPARNVHAIQMELACRGYMDEPAEPFTAANWPTPFDTARAAPMQAALTNVLQACIAFAQEEKP
ncbi:N-formylglutamate deformylase [Vitreimonas flagellata]|uniref:N-formylglutamate deformylase n=1 Tax=Vitreimonas flagellata TaxID=2560861 RepID=UPI001074B63E|nr:N-formylglutamate deformylase [Vitreimonas flagellata]